MHAAEPPVLRDAFGRFGGTDWATGGRMKMKLKNVHALLVGAVIGAVVASAVGVAYAAIPDGGGVVHACFQNVASANKPVKLLDTAKATTCPSGWKPVSWNQKGQPGTPGSAVVLRSRATSFTVAPGAGVGTAYALAPLAPTTWTQAADEVETVIGTIRYTTPATCSSDLTVGIQVQLLIDGQPATGLIMLSNGLHRDPSTSYAYQINFNESPSSTDSAFNHFMMEPGAATPHTLGLRIQNQCVNPGQDYTITSLALDVIGTR